MDHGARRQPLHGNGDDHQPGHGGDELSAHGGILIRTGAAEPHKKASLSPSA